MRVSTSTIPLTGTAEERKYLPGKGVAVERGLEIYGYGDLIPVMRLDGVMRKQRNAGRRCRRTQKIPFGTSFCN